MNTIRITPPSITIKYNSDMKPPIMGNPRLTIRIILHIQLLKEGDNIREPLLTYLQYTAMNIRGEITTWLAPTIIPIHPISKPHKLICITLLYAITTLPSDLNIKSTPLTRPIMTIGILYPNILTNTIPILRIIPAKIIEPTIDASTCTLGNH